MNAAVDGAMARTAEVGRPGPLGPRGAGPGDAGDGRAEPRRVRACRRRRQPAPRRAARQVGPKIEMAGRPARRAGCGEPTLVDTLSARLVDIDTQIAHDRPQRRRAGGRLTQSLAGLKNVAQALQRELEQGQTQSRSDDRQAQEMGAVLTGVATQLREEMPPALTGVETPGGASEHGRRGRVALDRGDRRQPPHCAAGSRRRRAKPASRASARRWRRCWRAARDGHRGGRGEIAGAHRDHRRRPTARPRSSSRRPVRELVEALVRVRETANQAANHAREAIAAIVPDSVAALARGQPRGGRRRGDQAGPGPARRDRRRRRAGDRGRAPGRANGSPANCW